ncbi:hypothetical protein IE81DRAFT_129900 [Ceraceosorus guamensis]|uniref:Cation efflux protein transmembrane domain-containing protein n=1 Tax=Ceraceosorus guamensis TaxID=1522189 RepID=A0A316W8L7_9BASI|nr:hypothetical protein IE81DRAFT_129900 [Ceraceosorus guamensis]PWN45904.1 hypothetical protein IE81DRAFT_129900 [Ceraceosorus guamensis]
MTSSSGALPTRPAEPEVRHYDHAQPRAKNHHHHHHHHQHHPYQHRPSAGGGLFQSPSAAARLGRHAFPHHAADSLRDLSALADLIDDRTGWYEDSRVTDEQVSAACRAAKERGNGDNRAGIREFYAKQNAILDSWRECDLILDSQFPEEVIKRFGDVETDLNDRHARRPGAIPSHVWNADTGYSSEDDTSDDGIGRRFGAKGRRDSKGSLTAATSALFSGFWFGASAKEKERRHRNGSAEIDEESGLMHPEPQSPRGRAATPSQGYGSTASSSAPQSAPPLSNNFAKGHGLTAIEDVEGGQTQQAKSDPGKAGVVRATTPRGTRIAALEHVPRTAGKGNGAMKSGTAVQNGSKPATNGDGSAAGRSRASTKGSSSSHDPEQDDELGGYEDEVEDDEEDEEEPEGSLDRKLAMERAERKARQRQRKKEIHVPTVGKIQLQRSTSTGRASRSDATSAQVDEQASRDNVAIPGGQREQERRKLLAYVPGKADRDQEEERKSQFAININLAINVLLLGGKGVAVLSSNSVSLIASLVDSALDLLSTLIIFITSRAVSHVSWRSWYLYPTGKRRLEPIGIVVFSVLMIASFVQVLLESLQRLYVVLKTGGKEGSQELADLPLIGIAFMLLTIAIKTFMWLLYRKSKSSGVRAVAQDAENDVVFNIASLIFPFLGSKLGWPALDPIGGICLSIYIIYEWVETLLETISKLTGAAAGPEDVAQVLYLITRFRSVKSVSAFELYHAGDMHIAEADIVLPHTLPLKDAHDLGECVLYCAESLDNTERCFIHLDYSERNQPGHFGSRG